MGKTSSASKNKYRAKAYDQVLILVKKGEKDIIKAHAATQGESTNAFINRAIEETIERDNAKTAPEQ